MSHTIRSAPALRFTHVYVPTGPDVGCCGPMLDALRRDPRYRQVHDDGAAVFVRR